MSQRVTEDVAVSLKKGDVLYHNIIVFTNPETGEETPATAVVTGKMVKGNRYEGFRLPIKHKYCEKIDTAVTRWSQDLWRTTPEKVLEPRVRRVRGSATAPAIQEEPAAEPKRVSRVRRDSHPVAETRSRVRRTR